MLLFLQRHARAVWLLLIAFSGLCLGSLTSSLLGLGLEHSRPSVPPGQRVAPAATGAGTRDYAAITQRNIFDSNGPAAAPASTASSRSRGKTTPETATVAALPRADLKLIGTVIGGDEESLALIMASNALNAYRPGDSLPGGGRLLKVARNVAHIENADGSLSLLQLHQDPSTSTTSAPPPTRRQPPAASPAPQTDAEGIRPVAPNRWLIEGDVVEQARGNLGELLKSARMEPRLVNGATDGFVIAMLQPGSLLSQMGFRRGDVVMQVNGMPLDSPEKALQIFQQLREARSLRVHVERQGEPSVFEYDVN